ncbi:helix-turn-helix domain-containing protein [Streptomyces sp. NBC_01571]|uniref:helix-turn-helix domain-containing protein n=1 Tax=Streptomyces sp. NBC_01571 TaxID=2975883 RepID=UPI00225BA566|nr:helix-turn-helix transcriptional regulator [Streptomyces sp. NBC_01571]MCX4578856.1 helix-turn-helix domain-containing protein [Streptomyces sp. NBC_01571]
MTDEPLGSRRAVEPTPGPGPTTRRRQLAFRLLELRRSKGLSAEEAGDRAGVSKATVSRYETSKGNVRWNQVDQLCRVYGASDEERDALVELAKTSKATNGWWVPGAGSVPSTLGMLIALENEATSLRQFASSVVPGLLQTSSYARSIKGTPGYELPPEQVTSFLDTRMRRQQLLDQPTRPRYHVLLDESVLRRCVGGPDVMTEQLDHLLERGSAPGTTVQILPFDRGAYSAALTGFIILGAADPDFDVIYAENTSGSLYLEQDEERRLYSAAFDYLQAEALSIESSAELIAEASKKHLRA